MPDINNAVALGVNGGSGQQPLDLSKTLGTISQLQLANAHAGLYQLQAQQEQRKLTGFEYLKNNPTDYQGAIQAGLDPSVGSTLQTISANNRGYAATPGGLAPTQYNDLSAAGQAQANTRKIGVETSDKALEVGGKIAQMIIADPSDAGVERAHQAAKDAGVDTNPMSFQQMLSLPPEQRVQAAKAKLAGGLTPAEYTAPHNVTPTDSVTSRGGIIGQAPVTGAATGAPPAGPASPQSGAAPNQQGGMIGAPGERILGGSIVADNGGPIPGQPKPAAPFGTVAPAMTPGQKAESDAYGGEMAKVLPALTDKANNSRQANFTLDQMRQESQSWDMGKGGATLATAQQYLKPLANALGSTMFDKPVADFESFQKNAGTLTRQAVKEVSPRAAVQEFQMIQGQLPSANMSRQGFDQIVNQFQAVNDFNIAKAQAGQLWKDDKENNPSGSMSGFETQWNKNVTPSAFLVSRLPPEQLGALKANLDRTPEGRATLKSITTQLQWAKAHNLDQLAQ